MLGFYVGAEELNSGLYAFIPVISLPKELSLQALRKENYDTGFQHHSLGGSCVALAELVFYTSSTTINEKRAVVPQGSPLVLERLFYYLNYYIYFYVNEYYAYMYISVPCISLFSKAQRA